MVTGTCHRALIDWIDVLVKPTEGRRTRFLAGELCLKRDGTGSDR